MNNFANNLKLVRKDFNVYQKDIAKFLDITVRQYQRYESGQQEPHIDSLIKLADYFNVSLDYLVGRSDNPKMNK